MIYLAADQPLRMVAWNETDPGFYVSALRRRSLRQFAEYLRGELARVGAIEAYACWDGDQEALQDHHRTLTASSLEADDFFFRQKELSTLIEAARNTT